MDAKPEDLNELALQIITSQKGEGYSLRNKTFNFGFEGPSQLDEAIPIIDQLHWENDDSDYDLADIRHAADRPLEVFSAPMTCTESRSDHHLCHRCRNSGYPVIKVETIELSRIIEGDVRPDDTGFGIRDSWQQDLPRPK